jgi:hypothetical protein
MDSVTEFVCYTLYVSLENAATRVSHHPHLRNDSLAGFYFSTHQDFHILLCQLYLKCSIMYLICEPSLDYIRVLRLTNVL